MRVTITGASGFIGGSLLKKLLEEGHSLAVLTRGPAPAASTGVRYFQWTPGTPPPPESLAGADAVVHLAGEPVAQRWTAAARQRILSSRVEGTGALVEALAELPRRPEVLISASAVGYYGDRGDEILNESSTPGADFLAGVCRAWEAEATRAASLGMRVVTPRIGVVLAAHGGALARMLLPFRLGAGGRLGSGRQWMSWIHLDDLTALIAFSLAHAVSGPINATAPNPVINAEFTRTLASVLRRPAIFPVPGFALRALFGEMAQVLLGGQRALPAAAQSAGFAFRHPELGEALTTLLK
jgi:uncharacterized protein (TIGR01777 family)